MTDEPRTTLFAELRPRRRGFAQRMNVTARTDTGTIDTGTIDSGTIDTGPGLPTNVTAQLALDMMPIHADRRTSASAERVAVASVVPNDTEDVVLVAGAVSSALLVVLDALSPAERVAFVLHDTFAVPFEEIADVLGRSPMAVRQLARRARAKVRTGAEPANAVDERHRSLVDAFLSAARGGDLGALVALLHPDVTLRADHAAVALGAPARLSGAAAVAELFFGRAHAATPAALDAMLGLVWIVGDRPKVAWEFTIERGQVTRIDMIADTDNLSSMEVRAFGSTIGSHQRP